MPIRKRSIKPPVQLVPKRQPDPYQPPGRALSELVKEHDQLASDAAWMGYTATCDHHTALANSYRKRMEDGELWETDF